jgi:hypothetical protein
VRRVIRLLYYLPMGRMSDYKKEFDLACEKIVKLEEENRKLKETIKDHQLYEEKLEHRIIEFEELLH